MSENIYVSNATNVLKEVIVCSPKFYVFNAINEITKSWMEKAKLSKMNVWLQNGKPWSMHIEKMV